MTHAIASVIVLNYNGDRWLAGCLDALAAQRDAPPFDVLVVDNASTDGSATLVRQRAPAVRLVQNGRNVGFAAGNNAGARCAAGRWLVFLNNDTVPAPDWLVRLCTPLVDRPEVGLVTSRIVFLDAPSILDSGGDGYLRAGGAFKHGHRASIDTRSASGEVFGACGAAFAIRREVFEELGGFDEQFFMVYEDVDLSYRAHLAGYRCWYAADAIVRHAGSGTLGRMSANAVFLGQRNLEWTWVKNTPWPLMWRTAGSHALYSLSGVAFYLRAGRFSAALRGKLAAMAGLPRVLRERSRTRHLRRVEWRATDARLDRGWIGLKRRQKRAARSRQEDERPG